MPSLPPPPFAAPAVHISVAHRAAATAARHAIEYVMFDGVAPNHLTLTQSGNALGTDDTDRVCVIWTSTRADGAAWPSPTGSVSLPQAR